MNYNLFLMIGLIAAALILTWGTARIRRKKYERLCEFLEWKATIHTKIENTNSIDDLLDLKAEITKEIQKFEDTSSHRGLVLIRLLQKIDKKLDRIVS